MDILLSILALVGFIALTVGTGFFVAIEFALTGLERSSIENHVANKGDTRARNIQKAHNDLSFELSGAQLGITITTLATGYLAEPVLARFFDPLLELFGLSDAAARPISLVLAMIAATLLSMVYGELVPKNMAITDPLMAARITVGPVRIFNKIFKWFINSLNSTANWLVRKMGIEPADELASARSAQELGALVRNSAKHGGLDQSKAIMLDKSLKFGEATAEEFMTPRSTIEDLDVDDTVEDLLNLALSTGHSRFPVTDGDLDATVGVVHVKEAFAVPRGNRATTSLRTLARPIPVVPASLDGDAVLNAVRSAGSQVVLVADEYGGTAGIVTIEDVVEEILGEVYDEHDDAEAERDYVQNGANWDVSGLVRVDDLPEKTGYFAPDGPYETLGGLIMATLGRIPRAGDLVLLPQTDRDSMDEFESGISGRWLARVTVMDERRVDRVYLTPISDEEAEQYA
ncbi:hemolysin family protein [Corynebacterium pygosceleis]|uniref:Hemolysin family protein n=1 Tax=Corynebacterium pygosceleis TaxID=2800406 RepID=A0A9Q4C918_9CORY|nr:hemolysin family protein [Corynebacterium pygosceleis]MCK7637104.1 hemolysin family protein [Corynebacterium pygosceleis]MCK7674578.1 hemolysin family protein [Corynebacterium pygosceleis]MCX7443668.1 hemolysin family protein [Corynebacterium pygosceleis]MCX7467858.1 hemolysin family protein [Corynebacterium pygosceleis]